MVSVRIHPEDDCAVADVTLIDAMLALTPEERLAQNDRMIRTVQELRDAFAIRDADRADGAAG